LENMNHRQEMFALLVAGGMAPQLAYVEAGYEGTAVRSGTSQVLTQHDVSTRIRELQQQRASESGFTPAEISAEGVRVYRAAMKTAYTVDRRGEVMGEKPVDLPTALSTLKMFAGFHGMTIDRKSIELSSDTRAVLDRVIQAVADEVSDPEIMQRIVDRLVREGAVDSAG
jgi:hypothetical protein